MDPFSAGKKSSPQMFQYKAAGSRTASFPACFCKMLIARFPVEVQA
jgi:hypothetical protein